MKSDPKISAAVTVIMLMMVILAVSSAVPCSDGAHIGGEGHGEGIDVSYSTGIGSILWISLSSKPVDYIDVAVCQEGKELQRVEKMKVATSVAVELKPLEFGTYEVQIWVHGSSDMLRHCPLIVGYTVTLTFLPGEGSGMMNPAEVVSGSQYELPASGFKPPEGKVFASWSSGGAIYSAGTSVTIAEDMAFTALYTGGSDPDVDSDVDPDDSDADSSGGFDYRPYIAVAGVVVIALVLLIVSAMRKDRSE